MTKVFITIDTEIWCGGWTDLDAKFPDAYRRYVYGPTKNGEYALPYILRTLNDHGLIGVFLVEPLFATRFGAPPLQELVGLIKDAGQELQLHLHTEWVDEAPTALLPTEGAKRPMLRQFSFDDQVTLLKVGRDLLQAAGAPPMNAFRAGSYAANFDTLRALAAIGMHFDTSYNPGSDCGVDDIAVGRLLTQPEFIAGVTVYPVTTFRDRGPRSLRHLQLTACSFAEIAKVLNQACDRGWDSVVIVAHNFELLTPRKDRPDPIVVRRFSKLCRFLERNADRFHVRGFHGLEHDTNIDQHEPILSSRFLAYKRFAEQLTRRALA